jgi:hypothetical protein
MSMQLFLLPDGGRRLVFSDWQELSRLALDLSRMDASGEPDWESPFGEPAIDLPVDLVVLDVSEPRQLLVSDIRPNEDGSAAVTLTEAPKEK